MLGMAVSAHHRPAGRSGRLLMGPTIGAPRRGSAVVKAAGQPKGRTPIQAAWAQKANPAQAKRPTSTTATVGIKRPGA